MQDEPSFSRIIRSSDIPTSPTPAQADTDETMIGLWLNGRSRHTIRAYEADVRAFLAMPASRSAALPSATSRPMAPASPTFRRPVSRGACPR